MDDQLARGETGQILSWLRENVHAHGSLYAPTDLMQRASGQELSAEPLLDYLETKYTDMLDL